jgi:hypothetical protein
LYAGAGDLLKRQRGNWDLDSMYEDLVLKQEQDSTVTLPSQSQAKGMVGSLRPEFSKEDIDKLSSVNLYPPDETNTDRLAEIALRGEYALKKQTAADKAKLQIAKGNNATALVKADKTMETARIIAGDKKATAAQKEIANLAARQAGLAGSELRTLQNKEFPTDDELDRMDYLQNFIDGQFIALIAPHEIRHGSDFVGYGDCLRFGDPGITA